MELRSPVLIAITEKMVSLNSPEQMKLFAKKLIRRQGAHLEPSMYEHDQNTKPPMLTFLLVIIVFKSSTGYRWAVNHFLKFISPNFKSRMRT